MGLTPFSGPLAVDPVGWTASPRPDLVDRTESRHTGPSDVPLDGASRADLDAEVTLEDLFPSEVGGRPENTIWPRFMR